MNAIGIAAARDLGKRHGARRLVIIALDGDDYGITTWGATRADCRALRIWAESDLATDVCEDIADSELDGGAIIVATEPGVSDEEAADSWCEGPVRGGP